MGNITLIGFSGSGKSTVGKLLAASLSRDFVDLDEMIEKKSARSVDDIIVNVGMDKFRIIESLQLRDVISKNDIVLAVSGGAVLDSSSRKLMSARSKVIWLQAEESTVFNRINALASGKRQISPSTLQALRKQFERMQPIYADLADITIDAPAFSAEQIVENIKSQLLSI